MITLKMTEADYANLLTWADSTSLDAHQILELSRHDNTATHDLRDRFEREAVRAAAWARFLRSSRRS